MVIIPLLHFSYLKRRKKKHVFANQKLAVSVHFKEPARSLAVWPRAKPIVQRRAKQRAESNSEELWVRRRLGKRRAGGRRGRYARICLRLNKTWQLVACCGRSSVSPASSRAAKVNRSFLLPWALPSFRSVTPLGFAPGGGV